MKQTLLLMALCLTLPSVCASQLRVSTILNPPPVYFCDTARINFIQIVFRLTVDSEEHSPIPIDSVYFWSNDKDQFDAPDQSSYPKFELTFQNGALISGPAYFPKRPGLDTLHIVIAFRNDSLDVPAFFSSRAAPNAALKGYEEFYYGSGFYMTGNPMQVLVTDTLHDPMAQFYDISSVPQNTGENSSILLSTCGGTVVDSIGFHDDFSEFKFFPVYSFPDTVNSGESLELRYSFTPSVPGRHKRPVVFYLHDGSKLIWSFEYEVRDPLQINATHSLTSEIQIFPNPTAGRAILRQLPLNFQNVEILNMLGEKVTDIFRNRGLELSPLTERIVDVSALPAGLYFVRVETPSGAIVRSFVKE